MCGKVNIFLACTLAIFLSYTYGADILGADDSFKEYVIKKDVASFKTRLFLDLGMLKSPSLNSPVRDIDRIVYVKYQKNPHTVQATSLEIKDVLPPTFSITSNNSGTIKSLADLDANDVRSFLLQLDILPYDTSLREFHIEKSKTAKGYYTSAVYNVYALLKAGDQAILKRKHMYVVKFYNPSRTTVHALWNQYGVKIKDLPRLSFEEVSAKVQLQDSSYYFSVLHAAQGQSALNIYRRFNEADAAEQIKQRPQILCSLSQIGKSLGTFHCYHALKNPDLRKDCIQYILKIGNLNNFLTVTHNDLHPGNIFVDLECKDHSAVALIDLESMYLSAISPTSNCIDVMWFTEKLKKILKNHETDQFIEHFKTAYEKGLKDTLKYFIDSNLLKDFVIALRSQSSPKAKPALFQQDSSEMSSDRSFY
ncbi:MAG: hypothetical protein NT128_05020 [Proteobacteria bacterium]|nr:hypothetical protein [Pseudomonadota bacterium]